MLQRAILGGCILLGVMGFVTSPQQLLVLRIVQGAVTGTVAAAYAFVAATTPAQRRGFALGMLQVGVYLGASLGPTLGGFIIDTWGFRICYMVSAVFLGAGAGVVTLWVRDGNAHANPKAGPSLLQNMRLAVRCPGVLAMFGTGFLVACATRTFSPMLPLLVQALLPGQVRVASLAGLMEGVSMACIAVASFAAGRYGERLGYRRTLLSGVAVAAVCTLLHGLVSGPAPLLVLRAVDGLAMGGVLVSINALLASAAPEGQQGAVFGLQTSVESAADAIGPTLGAALAVAFGLRAPFFAAAFVFTLAMVFFWRT
jgi:DHA1 family multidrug resistance protein-like MFS transporter